MMDKKHLALTVIAVGAVAVLLYYVIEQKQASNAASAAQNAQNAALAQESDSSAAYTQSASLSSVNIPTLQLPVSTYSADASDSSTTAQDPNETLLGQILSTFASSVTAQTSAQNQAATGLISAVPAYTMPSSSTIAGQVQSGIAIPGNSSPTILPPSKTITVTARPITSTGY